jgi:hypothetical protein
MEIPEQGLLADLTWSDSDETNITLHPNATGVGSIFRRGPTQDFCHINRLDFITRSHQGVQTGFKWFFNDGKSSEKLITVWSAPNHGDCRSIVSVLRLGVPEKEMCDVPTFTKTTNRILYDNFGDDSTLNFASMCISPKSMISSGEI